jgi:hypothetical protein
MRTRKTPIAAIELNVTYHRLVNLLRFGKIKPPGRDTSGHFAWTDADMRRAKKALDSMRARRLEPAGATP